MARYRRARRAAVEFGAPCRRMDATSPGGVTGLRVDEKRQESGVADVTRPPDPDMRVTRRARILATSQTSEEEVDHVP
ncbi:MAG: hypothetical protein EPO20_13070 [Betaproteobacteria bacterium]|nr:MAG: hypothetical protein EPO20_13070 [Betaproteobacteria bacterium]